MAVHWTGLSLARGSVVPLRDVTGPTAADEDTGGVGAGLGDTG